MASTFIAVVFILLSLFSPGLAFIIISPSLRKSLSGGVETIVAAVILSVSLFALPPLLFDYTLHIPILGLYFVFYAVLVAVSFFFLLNIYIRQYKTIIEHLSHWYKANTWLFWTVAGLVVIWGVLLVQRPIYQDWDGSQYYLKEGILYSNILYMPIKVPVPYGLPGLQSLVGPPLQPMQYAYGIRILNALGNTQSDYSRFMFLAVFNFVLLLGIGGLLYALLKKAQVKSGVIFLAVLIWMTYPATFELLTTGFLSVDIPYSFYAVAAVYYAIQAFQRKSQIWPLWSLASLACGLSFAVKIQGPLTILLVGLVAAYFILPRLFRISLAVILVIAVVAGFWILTPDLFQLVLSWHFALAILIFGLGFILFFARASHQGPRLKWTTTIALVITFVVFIMPGLFFLYRNYQATGSIAGWYLADAVNTGTANYEWAKTIDVEKTAFQVWRSGGGARPGLPQLRDLTPWIGYEWNPSLLIFALIGLSVIFAAKKQVELHLVATTYFVSFLTWFLLFGMDRTAQVFLISPAMAIFHAVGIERVLAWMSPRVTFPTRAVYGAALLVLSQPFWIPFFTYIQNYSPFFSLTDWKGSSGWSYYTTDSLFNVGKYILAVNSLVLSIVPLRKEILRLSQKITLPWLKKMMGIGALIAVFGTAGAPAINIYSKFGINGYKQIYTDQHYDGFMPALREAIKDSPQAVGSNIFLTYRDFALLALTEYRALPWNIADPVRNGYFRDLLTSRNMTKALIDLKEQNINSAILPADEKAMRFHLYQQTKYQAVDLPLLWLVDDSGVFPSSRVGNWKVIDLRTPPESFSGFINVLVEMDRGRGSLLNTVSGLRDTSQGLELIPVIDVSGNIPGYNDYLPKGWQVLTKVELQPFYFDGNWWRETDGTEERMISTEIFNMPSFDMNIILASLQKKFPAALYYAIQIKSINLQLVDGETNHIIYETQLSPGARSSAVLNGYSDTNTGEWVPYPINTFPKWLPAGTSFIYNQKAHYWLVPPDILPLIAGNS